MVSLVHRTDSSSESSKGFVFNPPRFATDPSYSDWDGSLGPHEERMMNRLAFLLKAYTVQAWWWELLEMLRKLILTVVLAAMYKGFGIPNQSSDPLARQAGRDSFPLHAAAPSRERDILVTSPTCPAIFGCYPHREPQTVRPRSPIQRNRCSG